MQRLRNFWLATALLATTSATLAAPPLTRYVDPFIGTDGTGHVFPGAVRPFGMVAPSPDNAGSGWSYSSGYQFKDRLVLGFSNTHISGAGIPELGDVLLMPAQGTPWGTSSTDFTAAKANEAARPGYYTVALPAHGVKVELTATQRVALHRYTFKQPGRVQVLVDLQHGLLFGDGPRVTKSDVQADAQAGEVFGTVHTKGWVEREASFVLRFSQAIEKVVALPPTLGELAPRYVLTFNLKAGRVLQARVALSTVDVAGARRNLAQDDAKNFDTVRREADAEWTALLGRIAIEAPARQQRIFYSALYRTLIHPSDIADADGRVRGPTGTVLDAPGGPGGSYYSTMSLWDTFRAVHPLLTLLVPERVDGFVQTMLAHHQAQGYLPLWTAWGRETHTMIGNPALPVIADAVAKGFNGFNREEALRAMVETSTRPRPAAPEWAQRSWELIDRYGYLPIDLNSGESVSKTLEYGYGDDAVARVATLLGQRDVAERFAQRAQGWRQLFDPQTQTARGKDSSGRWRTPFDPLVPTSPMSNPGDYTEANAWQYTATPALHDIVGFKQALGGAAGLERWLDRFFSLQVPNPDKHLGQEALIGQYAHGNEPSHHIAWLYAYTDAPQKGHALVQRIVRDFYSDRPDGIIGNDDCGQMSAWLVFATLGFYPAQPAAARYVVGVPQVRSATVSLANGKRLVIRRVGGVGADVSADTGAGAWLNGQAIDRVALPHAALAAGGVLTVGADR